MTKRGAPLRRDALAVTGMMGSPTMMKTIFTTIIEHLVAPKPFTLMIKTDLCKLLMNMAIQPKVFGKTIC